MVLVSFVVGGTQKGGTSALDHFLRQHPEICMPTCGKELHFFDQDSNFQGAPDYGRYHLNFSPEPMHRMTGETTPIYMYWRHAPERIHQYNPLMKWILVLRNPIDRAYSCWRMQHRRGLESLSFRAALAEESSRRQAAQPDQLRRFSYLDRSHYVCQLYRIYRFFDPSRCMICLNEDLRFEHAQTMARIFQFLSVDPDVCIPSEEIFSGGDHPPLEPGLRHELAEFFRMEIKELCNLLGRDLKDWLL